MSDGPGHEDDRLDVQGYHRAQRTKSRFIEEQVSMGVDPKEAERRYNEVQQSLQSPARPVQPADSGSSFDLRTRPAAKGESIPELD